MRKGLSTTCAIHCGVIAECGGFAVNAVNGRCLFYWREDLWADKLYEDKDENDDFEIYRKLR